MAAEEVLCIPGSNYSDNAVFSLDSQPLCSECVKVNYRLRTD